MEVFILIYLEQSVHSYMIPMVKLDSQTITIRQSTFWHKFLDMVQIYFTFYMYFFVGIAIAMVALHLLQTCNILHLQ